MIGLGFAVPASAASKAFDAAVAASKASMMANPAGALDRAREAEAIAAREAAGKPRMIAEASAEWLAGEATSRLDRPADALAMLETALGKAKSASAGDKLIADILLSRGWAAGTLGRISPALQDFQEAYRLYRRLGEQRGQAKALQNIGGIYHDAGDDERSLTYYSQVAELAGGDPAIGLAAHNNVGETLRALGRYHAAEAEFRRALADAKATGSNLLQVRVLTNLASAQVRAGDVEEGAASARRALDLAQGEASGERPFAIGVLAMVAEKRGDMPQAAQLLDAVFDKQDLTRTSLSFRDFHESAARVYAALGQDGPAYRHLSAFKRLDDGARALAATTNAALMAARFDFANQRSRISDLKAGQAARDRQLVESHARFQAILFSGAAGAGIIVLAVLLVSVFSLRRSRNEVRRTNHRLSDTNESLAKALRAKSEFLATTSHEIRTPLNGILGMTQVMLADARVQDDLRDRIGIVHGAGETMRALVDDILDLAKIENGNLEIAMAPHDPAALIAESARLWRSPAEAKGLAYTVDIGALPACAMGDETRLRQILFNVLSNAVKFTPSGTVALRAEAAEGRLVVHVADTGIGIPADLQEAIFDRFYQVDGGTTRQFGGTGLGLAICRHLVGAMGGTITVDSRLGGGSTFRIELPMEAIAVEDAAEEQARGNALVVVEPNPLAQRIMARALQPISDDVEFVASSVAACARIGAGRVGHVLVQVDPLSSGEDPLSDVRAIGAAARDAGAFLVLLYTPSDRMTGEALTALGADAVLEKPVAMKDVVALFSEAQATDAPPAAGCRLTVTLCSP